MKHLKPVTPFSLGSYGQRADHAASLTRVREISGLAIVSLSLAGMFLMLFLAGCGVNDINPASTATATTTATATASATPLGQIQGSNYGGHAPIVGAQIYVMQIGAPTEGAVPAHQTGYGSSVYSLLGSSYTDPLYPTIQDENGNYFVNTDGLGRFDISGDYTCTPGYPVYLYAASGNPRTNSTIGITQATVSLLPDANLTYTITFTTVGQLLYQGESIRFSGTGGTFGNYINRLVSTVYASNSPTSPTTTGFQIQVSSLINNGVVLLPGATYNASFGDLGTAAVAQVNAVNNPAIVNTAMLGLCPSSGAANFSYLNFVFMNEVSTVAMAYAMAPFAMDSLDIGTSTTNLTGLQNAALNAATLYNIQGAGPSSTTADGDFHTANVVNPNNSNGTVPYLTINTLGNILANCVDSANTVVGTDSTTLSQESPACSGLFELATSNGIPYPNSGYGTIPTDTATAAINIAHYPAGAGNTYSSNAYQDSATPVNLFNLPTGNVPFTPQLNTAPKDWTIALTYTNVATPSAIAIDAVGDAYIASYAMAGKVTELSPQGAVLATSAATENGLQGLAIDPTTNGLVWAVANGSNQLVSYSTNLTTATAYSYTNTTRNPNIVMTAPTSLAIDTAGKIYVGTFGGGSSGTINFLEFNNTNPTTSPSPYYLNNLSGLQETSAIALDTVGGKVQSWLISNMDNLVSLWAPPSTAPGGPTVNAGGFARPTGVGIDGVGNAWVANGQNNRELFRVTSGGVSTYWGTDSTGNTPIGGLSTPVTVAVDGSNNIWLANSGNGSLSEFNNTSATTSLSPSVGFQSGKLSTPSAMAIDSAGSVWVTNQGNSTVTEIIGSAYPVSTPLSTLKPGVKP